ncbi:MAG: transaldolase [Gemmatimonadota bacterium]
MPNPLCTLRDLGQSVWLDYIRRDLFEGELDRLIEEDCLAGMTSNPTIFDKAIADTELYDDVIRELGDTEPGNLFERIAVLDIQTACDHFRSLFDETDGRDGFVSIEVNPHLARDTEGTIAEVRRLWRSVGRPNVMVKIPGTAEGLPAIRQCLAEGVNINITLLFSIDRYREVMEMWFQAMEERVEKGEPLDSIASVASFFVSRVDSKVDERLEKMASEARADAKARLEALRGKVAIDNARLAYAAFEETFRGKRFDLLAARGARVQRPLWASTSTKNPAYPDVYYADNLVAPQTVNTLPPETIEAFRDHGDPTVRIHDDLDQARERLIALANVGIDIADVTRELEEEGVEKFADSYDQLLESLAEKQRQVQPA